MAGLMEVLTEARSASQKEALMGVRLMGLMGARLMGLMGVLKEVRLVGLKEVRLVGPQDLSEVRAALHRFAQLVLVQARLPVLRGLVVLGLEVVFA